MQGINDEYCWIHRSPNGGWTCPLCRKNPDTSTETRLAVGMRVRIKSGNFLTFLGQTGVIYDYQPGRMWPWHVRLDTWPESEPGIAFAEEELEPVLN